VTKLMGSERHGEMSRMTLTMIASYTATSLNADEPRVELAKWRVGAKRKMERERESIAAVLWVSVIPLSMQNNNSLHKTATTHRSSYIAN
jgi:hypothetical protein